MSFRVERREYKKLESIYYRLIYKKHIRNEGKLKIEVIKDGESCFFTDIYFNTLITISSIITFINYIKIKPGLFVLFIFLKFKGLKKIDI